MTEAQAFLRNPRQGRLPCRRSITQIDPKLPFTTTVANGRDGCGKPDMLGFVLDDAFAPIPAVHATTTEPLEPAAAIQAGAR
jgi:hypothetical protein